jgi:hypothetical protein
LPELLKRLPAFLADVDDGYTKRSEKLLALGKRESEKLSEFVKNPKELRKLEHKKFWGFTKEQNERASKRSPNSKIGALASLADDPPEPSKPSVSVKPAQSPKTP